MNSTNCMANSTVLFIQQTFQAGILYGVDNTKKSGGVLPTSTLFRIHWSPLWMSVAESLSTNGGNHIPPHHHYTLQLRQEVAPGAQSSQDTRIQHPASETSNSRNQQLYQGSKQLNHHRLIQPMWKKFEEERKICSSLSRVLAESIPVPTNHRPEKSAHLA